MNMREIKSETPTKTVKDPKRDPSLEHFRKLLDKGDLNTAMIFALSDTRSSGREPVTAVEWLCQGNAEKMLGNINEAVKCFTNALVLNPDKKVAAVAHAELGIFYVEMGSHKASLGHLDEAISLDPDNMGLYAYRFRAQVLLKNYEAAQKDFDKALIAFPANPKIHYLAGLLMMRVNASPEKIIQHLNKALEVDGESKENKLTNSEKADLFYFRSIAYITKGHIEINNLDIVDIYAINTAVYLGYAITDLLFANCLDPSNKAVNSTMENLSKFLSSNKETIEQLKAQIKIGPARYCALCVIYETIHKHVDELLKHKMPS